MNKTLGTIGAATLLLASLITVQARDTITRQEFEQAAHQLEQGAEQGKISKAAARAGIEGLRKALGEENQGERPTRNPREAYARAEAELREAVKAGKISEEDAKARLAGLRKRLAGHQENTERGEQDRRREGAAAGEQPSEAAAQDIAQGIGERLKQVGERLKTAVANGDISEDEAWAKWREVKKTQVAPRLEAAVKEGKLSEKDAKEIWRGIERAELGEKLKAAVASGKLSEQEARANWEAFDKGGEDREDGKK